MELTLQTNTLPALGLPASGLEISSWKMNLWVVLKLVDNDEFKAIVEADDTQSTAELAAAFEKQSLNSDY